MSDNPLSCRQNWDEAKINESAQCTEQSLSTRAHPARRGRSAGALYGTGDRSAGRSVTGRRAPLKTWLLFRNVGHCLKAQKPINFTDSCLAVIMGTVIMPAHHARATAVVGTESLSLFDQLRRAVQYLSPMRSSFLLQYYATSQQSTKARWKTGATATVATRYIFLSLQTLHKQQEPKNHCNNACIRHDVQRSVHFIRYRRYKW